MTKFLNISTDSLLGDTIPSDSVVSSQKAVKTYVDHETNTKANTALNNLTATGKTASAHFAMPSTTYDNLTLGVSGSKYTAPADGWFVVLKAAGVSGAYFNLVNTTAKIGVTSDGMATGAKYIYIPASKGDEIQTNYSFSGTTESFIFVYANGAA